MLPGLGRVQRGAETAFVEIARALQRSSGMKVTLFGTGRDVPPELAIHTVGYIVRERFEHAPKLPALRSENQYEELAFILSLAARGDYHPENFDAVVGCSFPWVNWFLRMTGGRGRGPKRVFVTQNGDYMCARADAEARLFGCDGLICINPEQYARHRDRYLCELIPNGVDAEVYRPLATDLDHDDPRLPRGRPIVLMVSALIPDKRVDAAIRAVALVDDAVLVVAGDGRDRDALARLAAERLPDRHVFLGSIPRAQTAALYRKANAFLHLHPQEPFGIVYLEAAATGLPIVAPDAATPRWIMGDAALYADPDNPEAVAAALRRVLDPTIGHALGRAARERVVSGWTWDVQAARYLAFIERVVQSSS